MPFSKIRFFFENLPLILKTPFQNKIIDTLVKPYPLRLILAGFQRKKKKKSYPVCILPVSVLKMILVGSISLIFAPIKAPYNENQRPIGHNAYLNVQL